MMLHRVGRLMALVPLLSACSFGSDKGDEHMEVVAPAEAAIRVHERVLPVVERVGIEVDVQKPSIGPPNPCEDPSGDLASTVYSMTEGGQLVVGRDRVADVLRDMHSFFKDQGFEVEEIHWFEPNRRGELIARSGHYDYSLETTHPPDALVFNVSSPCYRAPEGTDPFSDPWRRPPEAAWDAASATTTSTTTVGESDS